MSPRAGAGGGLEQNWGPARVPQLRSENASGISIKIFVVVTNNLKLFYIVYILKTIL